MHAQLHVWSNQQIVPEGLLKSDRIAKWHSGMKPVRAWPVRSGHLSMLTETNCHHRAKLRS
jgi:hypothetical protein